MGRSLGSSMHLCAKTSSVCNDTSATHILGAKEHHPNLLDGRGVT